MKLAVTLSLVFCSVIAQDFGLVIEPPAVTFPSRTPVLLLNQLPKKIVDPTQYIKAAAKKHKVRPALVKGIVAAESAFNANAVSKVGALGLMQLMPETAEQFGVDPLIPEQNIEAGTKYLSQLIDRYSKYKNGLKRAIAAYNAGPGTVDKYRGVPPYKETRGYVTRVLTYMRRYEREAGRG
jgi:soluble lytic murein transglycosylase-like protein